MPTWSPQDVRAAALKHWIEPSLVEANLNQLIPNNTAVSAVRDMMETGDYAQATAANKPLYKTNQRFGRGVLDFDGTNDHMTGPGMGNLITTATGTIIMAFAPDDLTTTQDLLASTQTVVLRIDNGNFIARNTSSGSPATPNRPIGGVAGDWHVGAWRHGSGTVYCTLDDPDNTSSAASGTTDALAAVTLGAGNSTPDRPYNGKIGAWTTWQANLQGDDFYKAFFYFLSRWGSRGDALEEARARAHLFLQRRSRPRSFVEFRSGLRSLDAASAADVGMAHPRGPHPAAAGWLSGTSTRRPLRKLFSRFDPGAMTVDLRLADAHDVAHTFQETGKAFRSADAKREGATFGGVGSGYEFFRIANAYVRDPGDLRVVKVLPGIMKVEQTPIWWSGTPEMVVGGLLTEHYAVNQLARSSFVNGTTGITLSAGAGGTIALDTTLPLLFDTAVTPQALKFTSGGSADCEATWPATPSLAADTHCCFSLDYRADQGDPLSYEIVRNFDGWFWNNGTQAFQSGSASNLLSETAALEIRRGRTLDIPVGANASTLTVRVGFMGTPASGRIGWVYHVQLETPGGFPTSRIVTTTTTDDREIELIARPNPSGRRGWPNLEGSLFMKYTPLYEQTDLEDAGGNAVFTPHLLQVHHDVFGTSTGNGWTLHYVPSSGAAGQFEFFGSNAGQGASPPRATFEVSVHAGQTYRIGARWVGGVVSLFVDGQKGTDATINGTPTETDDSMIYVGGRNACDGYLTDIEVMPRALHDEAMKAWRT